MKRVIKFTKIRFVMFAVSILVILAGVAGTVVNGGFNLGIDFKSGLSQRIQIAPVVMEVSYIGEEEARFNILNDEVTFDIFTKSGSTDSYAFQLADFTTSGDLAQAMSEVPSVTVNVVNSDVPADKILSFVYFIDLSEEKADVNYSNAGADSWVTIDEVREVLAETGSPQIQVVGSDDNQEFLIRLQDDGTKDFSNVYSEKVLELLEKAYGTGAVIVKQSDYVGPRFSADLGNQVFLLVALALALILIYIWFRFELAFAVSAIIALAHDVLIMLGFIGLTQMEVVTATVAAVLTIVGYSLNDTIVVFDRIRENRNLMRDADLKTVVNTSITQSLSRTIITSLTTLLAVLAIYIFASGQIKDFALAMIVGVIVGTYSSIFIASPVLLGWINTRRTRKVAKDKQKYGVSSESVKKKETEEAVESDSAKIIEIPNIERKKKGGKEEEEIIPYRIDTKG